MLTKRQYDLLKFIDEHIKHNGYSPSFADMAVAIEMKSRSGVYRLLDALEERGFINRLPDRARSVEVLRMPDAPKGQPWEQVVRSPELRTAIRQKASLSGMPPEDQITFDLRSHYGLK
jgi:repressor LexA